MEGQSGKQLVRWIALVVLAAVLLTGGCLMGLFLVKKTRPGQKVTLTVLRDGEERRLEVRLGERPR